MKPIALLFLIFSFTTGYLTAQETIQIENTLPPGSITFDYAFAQFNTDQASSGLLIDRSMPFIKLERYEGLALADSNKITTSTFGLGYARLFASVLHVSDTSCSHRRAGPAGPGGGYHPAQTFVV